MIKVIKNKVNLLFKLLGEKNYSYLIIVILLSNFFFLKNCLGDNYGESISFFANDVYSVLIILGIVTILTFMIVDNIKHNSAIHTRLNNIDEKFNIVLKNVFIVITIVYFVIILLYLVSSYFKCKLIISDAKYYYYNIDSISYGIWGMIRNYIYIIFLSFIIVYYSLYSNISWLIYIIIGVIIGITYLTYSYHVDGIMRLFYGYYIGRNQFPSFSFEIFNYIIYMIFKLGVVVILLRFSNFIKDRFKINFEYFKYNFLNFIRKQNIFSIVMYFVCIGVSIFFFGLEYPEVLFNLLPITSQPLLVILCYIAVTLSFIYLLLSVYFFDRNKLGDFIFTRISPNRWLIDKIIFLILIMSVMRVILYSFTGFNIYALYDWLLNILIIIECGFVSLKDNLVSYILLSVMVILIIILEINYITLICLLLIPIINFINCKDLLVKKKY